MDVFVLHVSTKSIIVHEVVRDQSVLYHISSLPRLIATGACVVAPDQSLLP